MDTIQARDALPTYTYSLERSIANVDLATGASGGGMSSALTGSHRSTTSLTSVLEFTIEVRAKSGVHFVRNVLISPRPRANEGGVPLSFVGWTREEAIDVRARLNAWAEEWDDPEMDEYNIYL